MWRPIGIPSHVTVYIWSARTGSIGSSVFSSPTQIALGKIQEMRSCALARINSFVNVSQTLFVVIGPPLTTFQYVSVRGHTCPDLGKNEHPPLSKHNIIICQFQALIHSSL